MAYSVASVSLNVNTDAGFVAAIAVRVQSKTGQTELLLLPHNDAPRWVPIESVTGGGIREPILQG